MASVLLVQPVERTCDGPRRCRAIDSSLDRLPCVPAVIEKSDACAAAEDARYCSSTKRQPPAAGAQRDADRSLRFDVVYVDLNLRPIQRLLRRCERHRHHPRDASRFADAHHRKRIKIANLCCDGRANLERVEIIQSTQSASTSNAGLCKSVDADAVGADHAHPGDDHAAARRIWRVTHKSILDRPRRLHYAILGYLKDEAPHDQCFWIDLANHVEHV